jgi:hypothetical protein
MALSLFLRCTLYYSDLIKDLALVWFVYVFSSDLRLTLLLAGSIVAVEVANAVTFWNLKILVSNKVVSLFIH